MTIDAVGYLPPAFPVDPVSIQPTPEMGSSSGIGFPQWFERQLSEVNGQLHAADGQLQQLAMGEAKNLHQVMISLEEAKLSFQLLVQVRNHVLEAYQDVLRMQV